MSMAKKQTKGTAAMKSGTYVHDFIDPTDHGTPSFEDFHGAHSARLRSKMHGSGKGGSGANTSHKTSRAKPHHASRPRGSF